MTLPCLITKKISMNHQQVGLGGVLPTFVHQFGWWAFVYFITNIHRENGVYKR